MNYVLPVFLNVGEKSVENEVRIIRSYEYMRGNLVKNITPFYYPVCLVSLNYNYSYILDPYSLKTFRLNYRVPDTLFLTKLIQTISSKNPINYFREVYSIINRYSNVKEWVDNGVVITKVFSNKKYLNKLHKLLDFITIDTPNGIVYKPIDIESITETNNALLIKAVCDINEALLSISYLKNLFIEYRNRAEYYIYRIYEKKRKTLERIYQTISGTSGFPENMTKDFNYEIGMDKCNYRKKEQDLLWKKKYSVRQGFSSRNNRFSNKVSRQIKMFFKNRKNKSEAKYMHKQNVEKRYLFKSFETVRQKYLLKEIGISSREYRYSINLIDFYTNRIINKLSDMINKIEKYRQRITNLFIANSPFSDCCIYLRGYVVYGFKTNRVYTTGFLVKRFGYRIVFDNTIRDLLRENKIINQLLSINTGLRNCKRLT